MWSCAQEKNGFDREIERKIDRLVKKMTLEEKIGQMNLISFFNSNIDQQLADGIRNGQVGSLINVVDPALVNEYQRIAIEESRLGIPLIIGRDVIHGFKTVFPIPLGLAATFNPGLIEQGARVAAIEATSTGVRWTFSPMLDISR
ncbi:MAG TPA: glycoside hydrolase family 3 N-terminal domain-containing protein, partial [Bacteroidales bacterium]|nr:glycoside hydrolase family 3 N-terminal domain-containing protein [Bacteroidales bacterium]